MNNSERAAKVETYLSPNSMLCAWMTPEGDKIFINEKRAYSLQWPNWSEEGANCNFRRRVVYVEEVFPVVDQFVYFQRFKFIRNLSQQARSISSRTSPSTQTSARSSDGSKQL